MIDQQLSNRLLTLFWIGIGTLCLLAAFLNSGMRATAPVQAAAMLPAKVTETAAAAGTGRIILASQATTANGNRAFALAGQPAGNQPPVARSDFYSTTAETPLAIAAPGVLSNDNNLGGNPLTAVEEDGPEHGTLILNGDGSFIYRPDVGFTGSDSFNYMARDGETESNTAHVTIEVLPEGASAPPVAMDDSFTAVAGSHLTVKAPGVLGNDSDPNGDTLMAILEDNPEHGALVLNRDGSFTYTPDEGFSGSDSFNYMVSDGKFESNTAHVTIEVLPEGANAPPVAIVDSYTAAVGPSFTVTAPGVLGNDSDANGDTLTALLDSPLSTGDLALNGDGSFTYKPPQGFAGTVSFTYRANDDTELSAPATVTITVLAADSHQVYLPLVIR